MLCEFCPHLISNAKLFPLEKLSSTELYKLQTDTKIEPPTSQKKLLHLLCLDVLPWKKIYNLIRTTSIDSYSRIFQYKCLNSILFLNNTLHKLGFSESPLCSYCHLQKETIKHLFFDCDNTKALWSQIQSYFESSIIIPDLDRQSAIVGFLNISDPNNSLLNKILLTFKITLYKFRESN